MLVSCHPYKIGLLKCKKKVPTPPDFRHLIDILPPLPM